MKLDFEVITPCLVAFVTATMLMIYLAKLARKIGLVDYPTDRKTHQQPIPLIGGIAMITSLTLSMMFVPYSFGSFRILFFCIGVLLIVGVLDDYKEITVSAKLVIEIVLAAILVTYGELVVFGIGDVWATGYDQGLGILAIPFSIVAVIGVINAFNMTDGIDGLAGSVALLGFIGLLIALVIRGLPSEPEYLVLVLLMIVALAVFLCFNIPLIVSVNKQVFMGDAGSTVIGLLIVFLLIEFSQREVPIIKSAAAPWIIGVPLLDMVSVIIGRIREGRSPFYADRKHLHHLLQSFGLNQYTVLFLLVVLQGIFVSIGVLGTLLEWKDQILFVSIFPVVIIYSFVKYYVESKLTSD